MRLYEDHCELVADFWAVLELGALYKVPSAELVDEAINFFHRMQRGTVVCECVDDYWRAARTRRRAQSKFLETRRQRGLCVKCGKPVDRQGSHICSKCAARMRKYNALRQLTPEERASAIAQKKGEAMACSQ